MRTCQPLLQWSLEVDTLRHARRGCNHAIKPCYGRLGVPLLPSSSSRTAFVLHTAMPPSEKQIRISRDAEYVEADDSYPALTASDADAESQFGGPSDSEMSGDDGDNSLDTDDEIAEGKLLKSKKTLKRKRRATDATHFGATLQSLLNTNVPSAQPLSLKPSLARKRNDEKLEAKGKKALQVERKEKEEKGRVRDIIGGWGGESERALRKVAQRGGMDWLNTSRSGV
jgi:hypothetical protein